jgi:hypothetical protein
MSDNRQSPGYQEILILDEDVERLRELYRVRLAQVFDELATEREPSAQWLVSYALAIGMQHMVASEPAQGPPPPF